MRNILITLMLCAITLTTSSVFAEKFDESRRTERLGLSYYDGRPLYVVMFGFTGPDAAPVGYTMSYYRVFTGDNLSDFGTSSFQEGRKAVVTYGDTTVQERYFYSVIDADGMTVFSSNLAYSYPYRAWTLELLERYPPPRASTGDLGVNVADEIFGMVKDIFGELFPLFAGIFALAAGSKYFEHLAKTGVKKKKNSSIVPTRATQEYFTLEKEVDQFSLTSPNANSNKDLESNERRRFLDRLAGNDVEETNSVRESYITGARWGREFSEELQESNRRLLNDFEALDDFYRERLIQEFERLSFTQEAGFLKSYRSYAYGVGDDHQNGNPFADESDFAQTPWGGSRFGGGDFEDANWLLDEEYYDSYDGAY